MRPVFDVPVVMPHGRKETVKMVPFANIGKWYKDRDNRPDPANSTYSYAIWLKSVCGRGFQELVKNRQSGQP